MLSNNRYGLETITGKIFYLHIVVSLIVKTTCVCTVVLVQTTKPYGGGEVQLHSSLTSIIVGDKRSSSNTCGFIIGDTDPCTHSIADWVGPRVRLDALEKKKSLHLPVSKYDSSAVQPVA
jgi:hypothetical protein